MGKFWLIPLILVWALGLYLISHYYWERPENTKISISDRGYYPINYNSSLICKDLDSIYITEGDKIECEYTLQSDSEVSLLPNIERLIYDAQTEDLVISGFEYSNISFQKAYELSKTIYTQRFEIYPTVEGRYELKLISDLYLPPVFYKFKETSNINLSLTFEQSINNLSSVDWFKDYMLKNVEEYSNEIETEHLHIKLNCVDYLRTWFTNNLAHCFAIIRNKQDKETHVLTNFKVFKEGVDITNNEKVIKRYENMFNIKNNLSIHTKTKANEEFERFAWFYPQESGNYTIYLQTDVIDTNLVEAQKATSSLRLPFKTISREEYAKKEENRRTILITLIVALFFSTPVALRAIKELITKE